MSLTTRFPALVLLVAAAFTAWSDAIRVGDAEGRLIMQLACASASCGLTSVIVGGREVAGPGGVYTGIKVGGRWLTSRDLFIPPTVRVEGSTVRIDGIRFGTPELQVEESWTFIQGRDTVTWRIRRTYSASATLDDMALPGWEFAGMDTWTGALLGTGGVAWPKLMPSPNATYGVHTGRVTLWNKSTNACLRIDAPESPLAAAVRFSHQPGGAFSLCYLIADHPVHTRHELRRFLADRQDVWAPVAVESGADVAFTLRASDYAQVYERGDMPGIDEEAVREICNTIARIGVIDRAITGSNGWYSGYAVLQEHWLAQLGFAIDDPAYFRNYALTLDDQRDNAVGSDGRVKPRWAYGPGDAAPGTYDAHGFYECQWGHFMDVQPCYVTNVAELFDLTGDTVWIRGQKDACERALDYLIRRDEDGDGLFEMMTRSHAEARGADWLDVVWAAHENAMVNAQMYNALLLWADIEEMLADAARAAVYRTAAAKLKQAYNRSIADGGLWNPDRHWYVHWRDADDTIHGDNLVLPVNFMAIAFGICDEPARKRAILEQIETAMRAEGCFLWPSCMYSYKEEEGLKVNQPFPNYENGDIFLAWAEAGIRAYAGYDPAIALKYVRNALRRYQEDGLAFQRYRRQSQRGAGDDILANNAMPVVGLYRDIYGIIPKWNRLALAPHLPPELNGTRIRYWLRGREYLIELSAGDYKITCGAATVHSAKPFAVSTQSEKIEICTP